MRPKDRKSGHQLIQGIERYRNSKDNLPGIFSEHKRNVLVEQILESIRRTNYVYRLKERPLGGACKNPTSETFNPIKASIEHSRNGEIDEAAWLIFLASHFSCHDKDGWRLVRDFYRGYDDRQVWTWHETATNLRDFREWLREYEPALKGDGVPRRCGSHRKYISLKAEGSKNTYDAVVGYVNWIGHNRGHHMTLEQCRYQDDRRIDDEKWFDILFHSMRENVPTFGRLGTFDYLNMIKKVGLAEIKPGIPYLDDATGPNYGAKLLFYGDTSVRTSRAELDQRVKNLGCFLGVGMQEMEDALCNWQKSPDQFKPFRG